ncbi:MAG: hypothetical protein A2Y24_01355 [Clostridiales bacterium GWE2_32_10]|nr:MAG: hypothetical protein A2Y24_01355 [Clostridiales bacterium GWE2_32_10]HBY19804.1 hypothetical protein [Clostridiales bacterium]
MAGPKYKLTVNESENVENAYFKMPTITVEEIYEEEVKEKKYSEDLSADNNAFSDSGDARKKELDRIKKWIEDRRKTMEANKDDGSKEANESEKTHGDEKNENVHENVQKKKKDLDEQRKMVDEKRKKVEEMIAKMKASAGKEDDEDTQGFDQAHMLRRKVQEKIEILNPEKIKEEVKKEFEVYEKRKENIDTTIEDDMKEVIREVSDTNLKPEMQNKLVNDLSGLKMINKGDVHSIFEQLNKIKN